MNSIKCTREICEDCNIVCAISDSALFLVNFTWEQMSILHSSLEKRKQFLLSTTGVEFELGTTGWALHHPTASFINEIFAAFSLTLKAYFPKGLKVSPFCFPQSCILLQLTNPSLCPFLKTSRISCLGQKYMQLLSQCSLVWKRVWLINIDYNPPAASKNWLPRFLIWMPLCPDFTVSVTVQWERQGQRVNPLLKGPNYLYAPLWKTLAILLVLLYHPVGWSFVSTASNCCKLSVCTFGPCSTFHFLLREEQWYWFWIARENARDISKELREHNT